MKSVKLKIEGRVQGVGFRYFALRTAQSLGINGYVRNLYDGSVEVYAEGNNEELKKYIELLRKGSSYSYVTNVITEWQNIDKPKYNKFQITF